MSTIILVAGIGILAIIAHTDLHQRRIPNALAAAIALLGVVRLVLIGEPAAAGCTLAAAVAIFVAGFLLFWRGAIGGGDAKLMPAMALLVDYHKLLSFLFLMSLFGGALALAILARDKLRPRILRLQYRANVPLSGATQCGASPTRSTVPYGVAIAASGIVTLISDVTIAS